MGITPAGIPDHAGLRIAGRRQRVSPPVHELSLAVEIGRLAEARLGASVPRCVAVGVDVGVDSGVEPSALAFCLEAVLSDPPWTGARPVLNRADGDVLQVAWLEIEDDEHSAH
ncbi:MAG: hypothetical protein H3C62_02690 [Gemmatimonadaceae bacterium]|nr:hypothetical protein [Gemmatimonadaceae bacterium]